MYNAFGFPVSKWATLLLAGDLFIFSVSVFVGAWLAGRYDAINPGPWLEPLPLMGLAAVYLVMLYIGELYDFYTDFRRRDHIGQVILWTFGASILGILLFCYFSVTCFSVAFLEWQAVVFIWLLVLWRYSFSALALPNRLKRRLIIVGAGTTGRRLLEALERRPSSGFEVVGFVDDDPAKAGSLIQGLPVLGNSGRLESLVKEHKVNLVVLAITHEKSPWLMKAVTLLSYNSVRVTDMPSLYEAMTGKIPVDHISDSWLLFHSLRSSRIYYRHFKRLVDLFLSLAGLVILSPLMLLIAAAIKLDSPGPVLFRQNRLGLEGRPFVILKFRTMFEDAAQGAPKWASARDPRVTRVGRVLRWFRLDELPQLINVLKGEMSLIGPRAEWDAFACGAQEKVIRYRPGRRADDPPGTLIPCGEQERLPFYSFRTLIRPGITGWAQVKFPLAGSSLEDLKEKLQYDLYYIKNMSFLLDVIILLKTVRIVLLGKGK